MVKWVDVDGTVRLTGQLEPPVVGLGFNYQETQAVTLLVTPNATIIGDVSPGFNTTGIILAAIRVRNPAPNAIPHDLHFTGFPGGGSMDVTVQPGEDDTVSLIAQPFSSSTWQVWGVDDQAAAPGEVGCVVIVCQSASYFQQ